MSLNEVDTTLFEKAVREAPEGTVFIQRWQNRYLTTDATGPIHFRLVFEQAAHTMAAYERAGVTLRQDGGAAQDCAIFETTDRELALRYGFLPERRP